MPLVSVIFPVYNQQEFVEASLRSILNQSLKDLEVIVINDCSTDNSLEIISSIKDPRLIVYSNEANQGLSDTLNFALSITKSDYVARMDADDISHIDRLLLQYEYLKNNPGVAVVGCWISLFRNKEEILAIHKYPQSSGEIKATLLFENCIAHPAVMFRKSIIQSVGGYTNKYPYAEDWDLWIRVSRDFEINNIQNTLLNYRIHENSVSKKHTNKQSASKVKLVRDNLEYFGFKNLNDLCLLEEKFEYKNLNILYQAFLGIHEQNEKSEKFSNYHLPRVLQNKFEGYLLKADSNLLGCFLTYLRLYFYLPKSIYTRIKFLIHLSLLFFRRKFKWL